MLGRVGGLLNAVVTAKGRTSSPPSSRSVPANVWDTRWVSFGAFGGKRPAAVGRRGFQEEAGGGPAGAARVS